MNMLVFAVMRALVVFWCSLQLGCVSHNLQHFSQAIQMIPGFAYLYTTWCVKNLKKSSNYHHIKIKLWSIQPAVTFPGLVTIIPLRWSTLACHSLSPHCMISSSRDSSTSGLADLRRKLSTVFMERTSLQPESGSVLQNLGMKCNRWQPPDGPAQSMSISSRISVKMNLWS